MPEEKRQKILAQIARDKVQHNIDRVEARLKGGTLPERAKPFAEKQLEDLKQQL